MLMQYLFEYTRIVSCIEKVAAVTNLEKRSLNHFPVVCLNDSYI